MVRQPVRDGRFVSDEGRAIVDADNSELGIELGFTMIEFRGEGFADWTRIDAEEIAGA